LRGRPGCLKKGRSCDSVVEWPGRVRGAEAALAPGALESATIGEEAL
jgi:hypothetical protein